MRFNAITLVCILCQRSTRQITMIYSTDRWSSCWTNHSLGCHNSFLSLYERRFFYYPNLRRWDGHPISWVIKSGLGSLRLRTALCSMSHKMSKEESNRKRTWGLPHPQIIDRRPYSLGSMRTPKIRGQTYLHISSCKVATAVALYVFVHP